MAQATTKITKPGTVKTAAKTAKKATKTTVRKAKSATAAPKSAAKTTTARTTAAKATAGTSRKIVSKTATANPTTLQHTAPKSGGQSSAPTVTPKLVPALQMKKKELIDKVVLRSGIKKKDAKPVVEAMLAVLGETIADERELNLQPLGKLKINRIKHVGQDRIIICRVRQSGRAKLAAMTGVSMT